MAARPANQWLLVSPNDRPEWVAARAVRARLAEAWKRLRRAAKPKHPSAKRVHALRVASRRAAAALKLFAEFLPKKRAARLKKELTRMRRAAGGARDLDVLATRLAREIPGPAGKRLVTNLSRRRAIAQAPIVKLYKRLRRGRRFQDDSKELVRRIRPRTEKGARESEPPFGDWARRQLDALVAEFFAAEPGAAWDQKAWHAFRIQGKALRYAMELAAAAFSPAWRDELYPLVAELQDRLGTINDLATAPDRLAELLDVPDESTSSALAEFVERQEDRIGEAREEFASWYFDHARHALREGLDRELGAAVQTL